MKTIKVLSSLLLASAFMVGCSDDDVALNSADCKVGFDQAEITVKESADLFTIPVSVAGEQNGVVNVKFSVEEYGNSPAKEDVNYFITDKTLTISADDKTIDLEVRALDDEEINEARKFVVKIASADGAAIDDSKSSIVVTLKDNDSNFYDKLAGKWAFKCEGDAADAKLLPYPETDAKYEKEFVLVVYRQGVPLQFTMNYAFDMATKKVVLSMPVGEMLVSGVNFGDPLGVCDVYSMLATDKGLTMKGEIEWVLSDDMKQIKANTPYTLVGGIFQGSDFTRYAFFQYNNCSLSR